MKFFSRRLFYRIISLKPFLQSMATYKSCHYRETQVLYFVMEIFNVKKISMKALYNNHSRLTEAYPFLLITRSTPVTQKAVHNRW